MHNLPETLVKSATRQFQLAHSAAFINPGRGATGEIQKRAFLMYLDDIMRIVFFGELAQLRVEMIAQSSNLLKPGKSPKDYVTKLFDSIEHLQLRLPSTNTVAMLELFEIYMAYYVSYKRAYVIASNVSTQMVDWMLSRPSEDVVFAGRLLQELKMVSMNDHLKKTVEEIKSSPDQLRRRMDKMESLGHIARIAKKTIDAAVNDAPVATTGRRIYEVRH